MHILMSYGISQCPKSRKSEFPQLPGQYPETFCYIEHCTVLYSAEYQYPSEYKDFFKLGPTCKSPLKSFWTPRVYLGHSTSRSSKMFIPLEFLVSCPTTKSRMLKSSPKSPRRSLTSSMPVKLKQDEVFLGSECPT